MQFDRQVASDRSVGRCELSIIVTENKHAFSYRPPCSSKRSFEFRIYTFTKLDGSCLAIAVRVGTVCSRGHLARYQHNTAEM